MVEAPGTAPGSVLPTYCAVYRHSWKPSTVDISIAALELKEKFQNITSPCLGKGSDEAGPSGFPLRFSYPMLPRPMQFSIAVVSVELPMQGGKYATIS